MNELLLPGASTSARQFLFEGLVQILGDGGLALRDGFLASAAQRDYSQRWCEAICRSIENRLDGADVPASIMLASADTGTGKTMGYAIPLLLRAAMGAKVAVSTHSHALQQQFLGTPDKPGDIRRIAGWIRELTGRDLRIARRIGRQAFISASAVEHLRYCMQASREALRLTVKDLEQLEPLIEFAGRANDGLASGLIADIREQLGNLPLGITASSIGLSSDSDEADFFAYDAHLQAAESADVVIVSHTYIASCALYRRGQILNSPIDAMVIDEADRLTEVASSTFRFDVSLRRVAAGFELAADPRSKSASQAVHALANYVQSLYTKEKAVALVELTPAVNKSLTDLARKALDAMTAATAAGGSNGQIGRDSLDEMARQTEVFRRFVAAAGSMNLANSKTDTSQAGALMVPAISFSPVQSLPSLAVMPVNPGTLMARLWNLPKNSDPVSQDRKSALNAVLLTSATLGAPGHYADAIERFRGFAADLGVYVKPRDRQRVELDLWAHFEPEVFGAVRFILADPSIPTPVSTIDEDTRAVLDETWLSYAVDMIARAGKAGGRTLVLCTSYMDAERFAQELYACHPECKVNVIQQVRGQSTKDCEGQFLANKNSIWLSPTAWEGLNLPGAIQNLVIARLPFLAPNDMERTLIQAYSGLTAKSVNSILNARNMGALKRKFRQAMGRPIRSRTDKARIWIADPRFPLHGQSQIAMRHPGVIRYSTAVRYPALHVVVAYRFQRALEKAEVFMKSGEILK